MRKAFAVAAILAASAAGLAAAIPAGASASVTPAVQVSAVTPDNNHVDIRLCSEGTNNLCMNGDDGNFNTDTNGGGIIKGFPNSGIHLDGHQDVNVVQTSNCGGGVVTATCPFSNHTLDGQLRGDQIVSIQNSTNLMFYRVDEASQDIVESPTGDGQVWVQDGDLTGANPGATLTNVEATDDFDGIQVVICTNGTAAPLATFSNVPPAPHGPFPTRCEWDGVGG